MMLSDFRSDAIQQLAGAHDTRRPASLQREMPFVAGDKILGLRGFGAVHELRIIRVLQVSRDGSRHHELAVAEHRERGRDLVV
jgi:hypothetical protein